MKEQDKRIINKVKKANFKYARTTKIGIADANPYEIEGFHCFQRKEYQGTDWLEIIKLRVDKYKNVKMTLHIWGHSWEIEKYNEWDKLEELFKYISERRLYVKSNKRN